MSNIEHCRGLQTLHYLLVKTKELTPKQILSVPCATCGAGIGKACELHTGALRTEPHRDRKLSAAEAVDARPANGYGRDPKRRELEPIKSQSNPEASLSLDPLSQRP
jgi:hypothetical protein